VVKLESNCISIESEPDQTVTRTISLSTSNEGSFITVKTFDSQRYPSTIELEFELDEFVQWCQMHVTHYVGQMLRVR